jgi:hypothetical protein
MNELVQFVDYCYKNRKNNLFVDLWSPHRPQDDRYPLSISREKISDREMARAISSWIAVKDTDLLQTDSAVDAAKERAERIDAIVPGFAGQGQRNTSLHDPNSYGYGENEMLIGSDSVVIRLDGVDLSKMSARELSRVENLLEAWYLTLKVTSADSVFGIGLTSDQWREAERAYKDGLIFYSLNHESVMEKMPRTRKARALYLFHLAVHESAHQYQGVHNERFANLEAQINREAADDFVKIMQKVSSLLNWR